MARLTEAQAGGANVLLFLDLIAFSEGTSTVKGSDGGYNVLYGGALFDGYQDHPRRRLTFPINGKPVTSTAAGRYQLLARYWDAYRVSLRLQGGFTPENLLEQAEHAAQSAAWWWAEHGLNELADAGRIQDIGSIINTGQPGRVPNGAAERKALYDLAMKVLA